MNAFPRTVGSGSRSAEVGFAHRHLGGRGNLQRSPGPLALLVQRQRLGVNVPTLSQPGRRRSSSLIRGHLDHRVLARRRLGLFEHYKSAAHTDYKEFEGRSQYTLGQPGWENVADYALNWCNEHTGRALLSTA